MPINPKMKPKWKVEFRPWQFPNAGEYRYGECPECGAVGSCVYEDATGDEDGLYMEVYECDCGCMWEIQRWWVHRFWRVIPKDER